MKKIVLMAVVCLMGSGAYSAGAPVIDALAVEGVTVAVKPKTGCLSCFSRTKMELQNTGTKAAVVGGHLVDVTGKAVQTATPFVSLTLSILDASGVDVSGAQRALAIAGSASNLATLLVSNAGELTSVSASGVATSLLTVAPALLAQLGVSSPYYNLCSLLLMTSAAPGRVSAFMPASYTPSDPTAATWSQSQKFLAWTAQLLSVYIQGGVTATGPDASGLITVTSSKGPSVQINTSLAAAPGVVLPRGYGYLTTARMTNFITMLTTGDMSQLNLQNTPAAA